MRKPLSNEAGIPEVFLKPYDPQEYEDGIYKKWEESGYFNPDNLPALSGVEGRQIIRIEIAAFFPFFINTILVLLRVVRF